LQSILNLFSANQFVVLPASNNALVVSASKPTDYNVAWLRLDTFGRPEYIYYFAQGAWLSRHPDVPGKTVWWYNSMPPDPTTFLQSFDGGSNQPISAVTGPMWQLAKRPDGTVISAQFPIAQGTLPSGKVLNVGDVGGDETNVLTAAQTPVGAHIHGNGEALVDADTAGQRTLHGTFQTGGTAQLHPAFDTDASAKNEILTGQPMLDGGGSFPAPTPVSNMPPYATGYLIQRSARLFYAIT